MMASIVVMLWLFLLTRLALHDGGEQVWRVVPGLIAAAAFTWFYQRSAAAVLRSHYARRDVTIAAALAVVAAALGGGDPMSWGFSLAAWLSVAALGVRARTAMVMAAGTMVTGLLLGFGNFLVDPDMLLVRDVTPGSAALYLIGVYGLFCVAFPWTNRVWMWIWQLAVQAEEGKQAHTRLALAEERLRFSRDLHDLVGHQLSAIAVKTELAVRLADADTGAAKAEMAEVNALTRKALKELRQAVRGYRELDLGAELNSVKGVLEAAGVRCETRLPHRELPEGVAAVFAYVVREAVTNVLKHSTATSCDILIRFTDEEAELRVRNDGVGGRSGDELGSGLSGLAERVAAVGGTLSAGPAGDGQFLLRAVVSLPIAG
ncbi:sensor histidine kinase [Nonomuraea sp. SBT364]|uniref:sensor histidine kinase n=1 Tax=Nonomuraea sp. SBT364 TaxID=1580530 RepID=UPI00069F3CB3|nr:sensor histidine kinase [Nonomuraea sp. SBT364]